MGETNLVATLSVEKEKFTLASYSIRQALDSVDFAICVLDASEVALSKAHDFLEKVATFDLGHEVVQERSYSFEGVVTRASDIENYDGTRAVELTVEGPLWSLARRRDSRIFQNVSAEKIIGKVLAAAGITTATKFTGETLKKSRVYTTQYEETDLAFLLRLLAEVGATFALRLEDGKPLLHFTEEPAKLASSVIDLLFRTSFGSETSNDTVIQVEYGRKTTSDAVSVSAYDPHRPSLRLEGNAKDSVDPSGNEIYWPLSRLNEQSDNEHFAKVVLDGHISRRHELRGVTGHVGLMPGSRVSIAEHPYAVINQEYLILSVVHSGHHARAFQGKPPEPAKREVEFFAVPVKAPLRPLPISPERRIAGPQTALTTGPDGEEIHTNDSGEVTVSFHWDRSDIKNDKSSRFMRTSQLPTGGSMLLPRVGWEVVVGFEEGDSDRPLVLSRLYNGAAMPPYALPEGALRSSLQTATTPGGGSSNELRMDDTKGNEQMFFNASKDMKVDVGNNTTHSVGNDHKVTVGANQKLTVIDSHKVTVGANQKLTVSGNQKVGIATLGVDDVTGNHTASVGGNRMQMIGGDHRRTVAADSELTIGGNAMEAVIGSVSLTTEATYTHTVGAALIEICASDRSLIVGGARSETTGAAKVVIAKGNHAVEVGALATQVGGAIVSKVTGSRSDSAGAAFNETVAGMEKAEAEEITIEAQVMLTVVMGGATLMLNPAMISITGANIKLDGALVEVAPLIVTN